MAIPTIQETLLSGQAMPVEPDNPGAGMDDHDGSFDDVGAPGFEEPESPEPSSATPAVESPVATTPVVGEKKALSIELPDGSRVKIKYDPSNEEGMKKTFQAAAQVPALRKQAEAFKARALLADTLEAEMGEMNSVAAEKGIGGVIDWLMEKDGAAEEWLQAEFDKRSLKASATPAELSLIEREERITRDQAKLTRSQKQIEEAQARAQTQGQDAEVSRLQAMVEAPFHANSFAGKLGDELLEDALNQAAWGRIQSELSAYSSTPSQRAVQDIVKKNFDLISRGINRKADQQVNSTVETAKANASKQISAAISQAAPQRGTVQQEFQQGKMDTSSFLRRAFLGK